MNCDANKKIYLCIHSAFYCPAIDGNISLLVAKWVTLGNADHFLDQVQASNAFSDRMLNLQGHKLTVIKERNNERRKSTERWKVLELGNRGQDSDYRCCSSFHNGAFKKQVENTHTYKLTQTHIDPAQTHTTTTLINAKHILTKHKRYTQNATPHTDI